MSHLRIVTVLSLAAACSALVACGSPADSSPAEQSAASADTTAKVVYFGRLEVDDGHLKSADGSPIHGGDKVTLRVFAPELATYVCRDYCMALTPHVFVRYNGNDGFKELPGVVAGQYQSLGPTANWPNDGISNLPLDIPQGSDRIETYIYWDRVTWNGSSCTWAYDQMDCQGSWPLDGAYLSNYGKNFTIAVE